MLKSNLLATKLHRPSLPPTWAPRPRLNQRLWEGLALNRPLTLVSAPAGFGKTACVSAWLDEVAKQPVAWLSLDPADNDPGRFFAYLAAALPAIQPNLGQALAGVWQSGQLPPREAIGAALINGLLELDGRFLLALDDFHVIQDQFILQILQEIVANPPPSLHLVLITREDPPLPLARLRAHNRLTEIRAHDLRFTGSDSGRFLNEAMSLSLSRADVAALVEKTEGWIAGLQLAALALQAPTSSPADSTTLITGLSGSHRFILSYLTEQVLDQQPEETRLFLIRTAILDKLSGDLCNAVTGRSDSHAMLERLRKANLFLIPLDAQGKWYRYHHLFADLLRERQLRLPEGERRELHRLASRWYAGAGDPFIGAAIDHALAAADYALAVDLLESHAMALVMQGYAKTVHGWVEALPAEWHTQSPRTALAFAWMHLLRGAYAEASPYLAQVQSALSTLQTEETKPALRAEWLVMRALALHMEGQAAESEALARRALQLAPDADHHVRGLACFALGSVLSATGAYTPAGDAYRAAIRHSRTAQNRVAEILSTVSLAVMAFTHGQLHLAQEIGEPVITRLEESGVLSPISGLIYGALSEVYYQWYRLDEARHYARRALELSALGGYGSGRILCRVYLSRLAQIEGDLADATRHLQEATALRRGTPPAYVRQELAAQQTRLYLERDRADAARLALAGEGFSLTATSFTYPPLPAAQNVDHAAGLLYNSGLRLLLHQARARPDSAPLAAGVTLADRLLAAAERGAYLLVALETLLLRAQMQAIRQNGELGRDAGRADIVRALELAEAEGIIALFLEQGPPLAGALARLLRQNDLGGAQPDYVGRILTAFSASREPEKKTATETGPAPPALIESLTERELEVLRLMADGLKYKEIAARLFISLNTVRFHVKAIYGKLNVNNRTQAIKAARQLHLF